MKSKRMFSLKAKPSIFITVPACRGVLAVETVRGLLSIAERLRAGGIEHTIAIDDAPAPHALERNYLAAEFLATQHSHHLTIDDDIGVPPDAVLAMLRADLPIIGTLCPFRSMTPRLAATPFWKPGTRTPEPLRIGADQPPQRVHSIGTGCMLVRRDVYEGMKPHVAKYAQLIAGEMRSLDEFFRFHAIGLNDDWSGEPIMQTEDYMFCIDARRAGFETYAHVGHFCTHSGQHVFTAEGVLASAKRVALPEAAE